MYRSNKHRVLQRAGLSTALALGAITAGAGIAGASTHQSPKAQGTVVTPSAQAPHRTGHRDAPGAPGVHGPGLGGVVTAVSSTSITVQTPDGTSATYSITSSTTVTKDHRTGLVSDVAVGERVRISVASAGSSSASSIEIELANIAGKVVSVNGNTVTVADRDGFYRTVLVGATTTYSKAGANATLADVTNGSFIVAEGVVDANHTTLDASVVGVGRPTSQHAGPGGMLGPNAGFGDFGGGAH